MQINSLLSVAQLREIQKFLPFGSQRVLASRYECSETLVSKVLKGHRRNDPILYDALKMAEDEKKRQDKKKADLQKRIANLST